MPDRTCTSFLIADGLFTLAILEQHLVLNELELNICLVLTVAQSGRRNLLICYNLKVLDQSLLVGAGVPI